MTDATVKDFLPSGSSVPIPLAVGVYERNGNGPILVADVEGKLVQSVLNERVFVFVTGNEPVASLLVGNGVSRRKNLLATRSMDGLQLRRIPIARGLDEVNHGLLGGGEGLLAFGLGASLRSCENGYSEESREGDRFDQADESELHDGPHHLLKRIIHDFGLG